MLGLVILLAVETFKVECLTGLQSAMLAERLHMEF